MKPKRSQRRSGVNCQGKGAGSDKRTLTNAKQRSLISSRAQVKPFAGKVFYLDLPSNRTAETLETDIRQLGGTVEKFFSKEIRYLISNKREARYIHCIRQDSPVPSPVSHSGQSSPQPWSNPHQSGHQGSKSLGQTETFSTSRGKLFVDKVIKEQERVHINKILSNALDWGVKVLYIDDVLIYVQKKKKLANYQVPSAAAVKSCVKPALASRQGFSRCKGTTSERRIRKPFIKVEDSSRHYRPIFLTMPDMPVFNLKTVAPYSPFCIKDKSPEVNRKQRQSEDKTNSPKRNKEKKRGGYCECCLVKYDDLTLHLQSECHKTFSKSDKYLVVDRLISTMPSNFISIQPKVKRKCSVSSVLLAPGPCRKPNTRHKEESGPSQIVKDKKRGAVDWCDQSHSGQMKELLLSNDSDLQTCAERKQRNCCTYYDRSRQRFPAHKKPCRQNSQTLRSQRNKSDIFELKSETPGEDFVPLSSTHVEVTTLQHQASSQRSNTVPSGRPQSEGNQQDLLFEGVQDTKVTLGKVRAKHLPRGEEEHISAPNDVTRRIQRKVRVYKHKKRKLETNSEQVKSRDQVDNALHQLWELFQSSDDMEVEFHGFKD